MFLGPLPFPTCQHISPYISAEKINTHVRTVVATVVVDTKALKVEYKDESFCQYWQYIGNKTKILESVSKPSTFDDLYPSSDYNVVSRTGTRMDLLERFSICLEGCV